MQPEQVKAAEAGGELMLETAFFLLWKAGGRRTVKGESKQGLTAAGYVCLQEVAAAFAMKSQSDRFINFPSGLNSNHSFFHI